MSLIVSRKEKILGDIRNMRANGKTLYMFGGNICVSEDKVINQEKVGHILLGQKSDMDVVSIGYEGEIVSNTGEKNSLNNKDYDDAFFDIFVPIMFDKNDALKSDEEIIEGLKNIVLFGHCGGGIAINYILNYVQQTFKYFNYDDKRINKIMKNILVVDYASEEVINSNVVSLNLCPIRETSNQYAWYKHIEKEKNKYLDYQKSNIESKLCLYPENLLEIFKEEYPGNRMIEILKEFPIVYLENTGKFVVVLDSMSDTSLIEQTNDHSIVSLIFATERPEMNPATLSYARNINIFVRSVIEKAPTTKNLSKLISDELAKTKKKASGANSSAKALPLEEEMQYE